MYYILYIINLPITETFLQFYIQIRIMCINPFPFYRDPRATIFF